MAEDLQSKATDFVKRLLTVGMGTVFLTEESLKNLVAEFKLPREMLGGILESANKTRREFLQNLSQEMMNRLSDKVDVKALVEEVLQKHDIELSMKISFKPRDKDS